MPCRIAYDLSEKWEQVEESEDDSYRRSRLSYGGGDAEAEQGDEDEVEHRPDCGAQRRSVTEGEEWVAVGDGEAVAGQDDPACEEGSTDCDDARRRRRDR